MLDLGPLDLTPPVHLTAQHARRRARHDDLHALGTHTCPAVKDRCAPIYTRDKDRCHRQWLTTAA